MTVSIQDLEKATHQASEVVRTLAAARSTLHEVASKGKRALEDNERLRDHIADLERRLEERDKALAILREAVSTWRRRLTDDEVKLVSAVIQDTVNDDG